MLNAHLAAGAAWSFHLVTGSRASVTAGARTPAAPGTAEQQLRTDGCAGGATAARGTPTAPALPVQTTALPHRNCRWALLLLARVISAAAAGLAGLLAEGPALRAGVPSAGRVGPAGPVQPRQRELLLQQVRPALLCCVVYTVAQVGFLRRGRGALWLCRVCQL